MASEQVLLLDNETSDEEYQECFSAIPDSDPGNGESKQLKHEESVSIVSASIAVQTTPQAGTSSSTQTSDDKSNEDSCKESSTAPICLSKSTQTEERTYDDCKKTQATIESLSKSTQTSCEQKKENSSPRSSILLSKLAQSSFEKAADYMDKTQYDVAKNMLSEAIRLSPNNGLFYARRASCNWYLRRFHDAVADLRNATELSPRNCEFYVDRAVCCLRLGDSTSAEQTIKKCLEVDSSNFLPLSSVMNELRQFRDVERSIKEEFIKKNYQRCLKKVDEGLKIAFESLHLQMIRMECLIFLKRTEEVKPKLRNLLIAESRNVELRYLNGLIAYFDANDLQTSLKHFNQALLLDPDHKKAKEMRSKCKRLQELRNKCDQYIKAKNYSMLRQATTEALEIESELPPIKLLFLNDRTLANITLGHLRDAIRDATEVLLIDPRSTHALLNRAQCYSELFEFAACIEDLEAALKIKKDNDTIKKFLKETLQRQEEFKKPIEYYTLLKVARNASFEEIRQAYKRMALSHHPDKHASSSDKNKAWNEIVFKRIGEAYAKLSDPIQRKYYDESLKRKEQWEARQKNYPTRGQV